MNISITGNLGAGKSSICRHLEQAGYSIISAGSIFRQIAEERGISVAELNEQVGKDMSERGVSPIDALLDERTARINEEQDGIAFDARLAWAFAKGSYKVFVCVDIDEAARRIYSDASRAQSESYESVAACREKLLLRQHLESERFQALYHLDYYDLDNYDLVIDSTHVEPEAVGNVRGLVHSDLNITERIKFLQSLRFAKRKIVRRQNSAGNPPALELAQLLEQWRDSASRDKRNREIER